MPRFSAWTALCLTFAGGCQKKEAATNAPADTTRTPTPTATHTVTATPPPPPVPTVVSTEPCEWPLRDTGVLDAWAQLATLGKEPGAGVIIGFPDTGYLPHPEIFYSKGLKQGLWLPTQPNSGLQGNFNLVGLRQDPSNLDKLGRQNLLARDFGHGTRVASVLMSMPGRHGGTEPGDVVTGVAYAARVLPIKVAESETLANVVIPGARIDNPLVLAEGIRLAVANGAAVVLVSLQAPPELGPSRPLHDALVHAINSGAIVIAQAGETGLNLVPAPALYSETIAIAASTQEKMPWTRTRPSQEIDLAAPGSKVCYADSYWKNQFNIPVGQIPVVGDILGNVFGPDNTINLSILNEQMGFRIRTDGEGTGYATAFTAGVAALWISRHGWDTLKERYGAPNVHKAFRYLARRTSTRPEGWPEGYGPGILNAGELLRAPLPGADEITREM